VSGHIPAVLQQEVRDQFKNCCAYCHTAESLTVAIFEIEHIRPRTLGGKTSFENLCLACPTCNRFKAVRTSFPDPLTQQETPLFHPQQHVWADHFLWSKDCTELTGLTPTGRATIAALRMNRSQLIRVRRLWVALNEHPPGFEQEHA
jgi:hypothetical protein